MTGSASPFVDHAPVDLPGSPGGDLSGLKFSVKDLFDVAGFRTGAGNPTWLDTHPAASANASVVDILLGAGAHLRGKTQTDELAFSLNGENHHYGTPLNPAAPGRIPGGSSSGSASAVAQGLVDFAIGTDTAGSIRVPASYCGIWGIRPTYGAVSMQGVVPLAPPFDTVGWLTRDADLLAAVGRTLLPADNRQWSPRRLVFARDGFDRADTEAEAALEPAMARLAAAVGERVEGDITPAESDLDQWVGHFRTMQGYAIWQTHGAWIDAGKPVFGPGVGERFRWASSVLAADERTARNRQSVFRDHLVEMLGDDGLIVLPTAPGPAPLLATPPAELEAFRSRLLALTAIASFSGCPQVTLPVDVLGGAPVGLSLIAPPGTDRALLALLQSL